MTKAKNLILMKNPIHTPKAWSLIFLACMALGLIIELLKNLMA